MSLQLQLHEDTALSVWAQERKLFHYVYRPTTPVQQSPKPYFHPLITLSGQAVTDCQSPDHPWHHGLSMTSSYLSKENFWGGPSYIRDQGYVTTTAIGSQIHQSWDTLDESPDRIALTERVNWITYDQQYWLHEQRTIQVRQALITEQAWTLELTIKLRNVSGQTLVFGSPSTEGRPNAGYGGLFWRGVPALLHGDILNTHGEGGDRMGEPAPWLAYRSPETSKLACTLVFIDDPGNVRYPNKWFVRNTPYPVASYSFMFDEYYSLAVDEELALSYKLLLADGRWTHSQIKAAVATLHV